MPEGDEAMVGDLSALAGHFRPSSGFIIAAGDEFGAAADGAVVVVGFSLTDDDFRVTTAHGC